MPRSQRDPTQSNRTLEQLDGTLVAILFARDGFTVARFAPESGDELRVVGDLAAAEEGQRLSLYGRSGQHPKYGPQFRVDYFHLLVAESRADIRRFLEETVEGIGPALAERIVAWFYPLWGDAMLERMLEAPDRLAEVPGLGDTKRQALLEALGANVGGRRLLTLLFEQGIAARTARLIQSFYEGRGVEPLRIVQHTPYQLLLDLPAVGWDVAERLARAQGLPADDPGRIEAATLHALRRAHARDGHLFLPEAALLRALADELWGGQPPSNFVEVVGDALEVLQRQRYVQIVTVGQELAFYARDGWLTEEGLAHHLLRLLEADVGPLGTFARAPTTVLASAEASSGLALDPAQRAAFEHALTSGLCIVTGGPGTGKSTLARLIVDAWEEAGLSVKLAAPTGRAARRLSETTGRAATTVHRLLVWAEGEFQHSEEAPLEVEALLVDESSMLDAALAHALLRALPTGCRLLIMGDVDQLPSVGAGNVLHELIQSELIPVARLTQIHRQDTSRENLIVRLAHEVNRAPPGQRIPGGPTLARRPGEGNVFLFDTRLPWARCSCGGVRLPAHCPTCGAGSVLAALPPEARGAELVQQLITERIPTAFGLASDDVQVIAPRYAGPLGVDEVNERLRGALNPARTGRPEFQVGARTFRQGDRVMAVRNNYEKDVVNGLQGRVLDADPATRALTVRFDDAGSATFRGDELDDLTHAYAITAHKSQGGEFPVVLMLLDPGGGRLLYRQLLYTAITRAKSLLVLVGDPAVLERATANNKPRHRWTGLGWWLQQWQGGGGERAR